MGVFTWVSAVSFQCPIESAENWNSLVHYLFFQFFFREKKFNKQKKKIIISFVFDCMLNNREGPDVIELALVPFPI